MTIKCSCKVGPGKFEGEGALTFMAWEQVMLGNSDISTGGGEDGSEPEVDWLRAPLNLDADQEVVQAALDYGYCAECIESAGDEIDGGVAVWEDGNGFVYCRVFETREEFDKELARAQTQTTYEVIVENIGTVYSGDDEGAARRAYRDYARYETNSAIHPYDTVTLMADGGIVEEWERPKDVGAHSDDDGDKEDDDAL